MRARKLSWLTSRLSIPKTFEMVPKPLSIGPQRSPDTSGLEFERNVWPTQAERCLSSWFEADELVVAGAQCQTRTSSYLLQCPLLKIFFQSDPIDLTNSDLKLIWRFWSMEPSSRFPFNALLEVREPPSCGTPSPRPDECTVKVRRLENYS